MAGEDQKDPHLILASASPRRAQLLRDVGYRFKIVHPPLDEPDDMGADIPPARLAEALSYFKARSVRMLGESGVIIGADTVVANAHRVFGKPVDREDARAILSRLATTTHQVITGLTVLDTVSDQRMITHDLTHVTMGAMSPQQIEEYLDTDQWRGKAGAYGIQDGDDAFVERYKGSFTNVVGLPMELLMRLLDRCADTPQPTS